MHRIALTGGIGGGKSVVLAELAARGAVVIDADEIAREVVQPGTLAFDQVLEAFGADLVGSDRSIDRGQLAAIVFADPQARARLEAIVHPLVRAETRRRMAAADADAVVVNAVPLLVEAGLAGEYDAVLVVQAPLETRLRRLSELRGMSRDEALARMAAQASDDDRAAVASWVLVNDGTLGELRRKIDRLWPQLDAGKGEPATPRRPE
jgi:dephospho-CoA kinase